MPPLPLSRDERHIRITQAGSLQALLDQRDGSAVLQAEALDPTLDESTRLINQDQLDHLLAIREQQQRSGPRLSLFLSTDDVIIIPGFMGSSLRDVQGPHGLIWVDPMLVRDGKQLNSLKLAAFNKDKPDRDAEPGVRVEARGAIAVIYDLMTADLEIRRYSVAIHPFDWRKDIDHSAMFLADTIRSRLGSKPRPLHLIAHSQGSLVARRAIQLLGEGQARRLVNNLVLLGPATFGTFSAALALGGTHGSLETARNFGVKIPSGFDAVLQSFTGLYQLLPWNPALASNGFDPGAMKDAAFWQAGADGDRLKYGFGWGGGVDSAFFNDRTTIILGNQPTVGAVEYVGGKLQQMGEPVPGDGTVPDVLAMLQGVRTFRVADAEHMKLPMNLSVMSAVRSILKEATPKVQFAASQHGRRTFAVTRGLMSQEEKAYQERLRWLGLELPVLLAPATPPQNPPALPTAPFAATSEATLAIIPIIRGLPAPTRPEPPTPPYRRLRVFAFDPLLATTLDLFTIAELTLQIPWERSENLRPGPVGDYIEVIDYDPASNAFYQPVDLTHPILAAQDGLPPSEADPQFHQQMVYAVAMSTITTFEKSLGRVALWAPRYERDIDGKVLDKTPEEKYVPRLRIYPHALREANAYYDPDRHAILFGYFPSREQPGGDTLPGGSVFTCLSFDIIAHETTHALLHGLHRYYLEPSNPDVLAFHEAFADAFALFQHFSHSEVVKQQVAQTQGNLRHGNLLGHLAKQFGSALGMHRGALRRYINRAPDALSYQSTSESHDRGAILMAALFGSFENIYHSRSKDLYRIATGGTGRLPDGDIHPDLVNRLAIEASKSAQQILSMCVRALDYLPPVDITFGEFLRGLITADYDLVKNDDRGYRVAVLEAFRSWGIYPSATNTLSQSDVLWRPPTAWARNALRDKVRELNFSSWNLRADRRKVFLEMEENRRKVRQWLYETARDSGDSGESLGLMIFGSGCGSIPRNRRNAPIFEVHSIRPSNRVGPDGQQRIDLVAEIVQRRAAYIDPAIQHQVDSIPARQYWAFTPEERTWPNRIPIPQPPDFWFRGGCTLIIDPESGQIRYCISKSIRSKDDHRLRRQRDFERSGTLPAAVDSYAGSHGRNPFAILHSEE